MNFGKLTNDNNTIRLNTKLTLIGRSPSCQIAINHRSISKEHATIDFNEKNQALLKDLNSLNGTSINNKKLTGGVPVELKDNDKISFGKEGTIYQFNFLNNKKNDDLIEKDAIRSKDYKISLIDNRRDQHENSNLTAEFEKNEHSEEDANQVNYEKELKVLQETLFLKQELLQKKNSQIEFLSSEGNSLKEELEKSLSKQKALELYASDLQRKLDLMNLEYDDKTKILKDLNQKDWVKTIQENNQELTALRKIIFMKDQEIEEMKKQYKSMMHNNNRNINFNASEKILDQQIKELLSAKKQLIEYENNSLECNKRWKSLIEENFQKEEKLKGFSLQIERQIENFKKIYSQFDQKIKDLNDKLLSILEKVDESESEAGKFLVDQMNIIQEEKLELIIENEKMHKQLEELIWENQENKSLLYKYQELLSFHDDKTQVISRMKEKIEELEDFTEELKEKEGIPKLIELNELVENLEKKLVEKDELIEGIRTNSQRQKLKENNYTNEENVVDFFSKLLQDKEKKIGFLEKELEIFQAKEKQKLNENEKIKDQNFSKKNELDIVKERNYNPYRNDISQKSKMNYESQDFTEISLMNENII